MTLSVEVLDSIDAIGTQEWDALVAAASAPVFYTHAFASAYEQSPLQPATLSYLTIRDGATLAAVIPCQLHLTADPLGTLAKLVGDDPEPRVLLTHVLHCYDTRLAVAELSDPVVRAACDGLRDLARDRGARWFGFANVAADEPLAGWLRKRGLVETAMPERYQMTLAGRSFDEFRGSLRSHRRLEFQRHVRRAFDAGVRIEVHDGASAHLEELAGLLGDLAGRHAAAAYYPLPETVNFVRALGPSGPTEREAQGSVVRVVEVWLGTDLLAGGVCFMHDDTFHMWAAGARYGVTAFSPYYVLVHEVIRVAFESGAARAEGGRGNAEFKRRHGFEPVALSGFVGPVAA